MVGSAEGTKLKEITSNAFVFLALSIDDENLLL
jgi:hypothetical protein